MASDLYKVKDLAQALGVGESTVRYWRDRYGDWLPVVGQGKRRRYPPEALDVLRFIQDRANRSEAAEDIQEALAREFPVNIEAQQKPQRSSAAPEQYRSEGPQSLDPELIDKLLERVEGLLQTQDQRMAELERENRELRDRIARLEQQQTAITQTTQSKSREEILAYITQLRKQGLSYRGIATRLNAEGIKGLRSGKWDGKTVSRLSKKLGID